MTDIHARVADLLPSNDTKRARLLAAISTKYPFIDPNPLQRDLNDAVARYADGEDLDLEAIAAEIHAAKETSLIRSQIHDVARGLLTSISHDDETLRLADTLPALDYLRDELAQLVAVVRDVNARLGSINDPAAAIRSGRADDWGRLDAAVEKYHDIRQAQLNIYRRTAGINLASTESVMSQGGLLADVVNFSPRLRQQRWLSASMSVERAVPERHPWVRWLRSVSMPTTAELAEHDSTWWPAEDHHAYLRSICSSAKPWLPTFSDAEKAAGGADSGTMAAGRDVAPVEARIAALARYTAVTGVETVTLETAEVAA